MFVLHRTTQMSNFYYKRSLSEEALTKLNKPRNIDINATTNTNPTNSGNSPNDRTNESPKDTTTSGGKVQQQQGQTLHASPKMVNLRSSRIPHVNTNK